MQNKPFRSISPTAKLLSSIFLILSIAVAKSIYLILFMTTLITILCICLKRKVWEYLEFIKEIAIIIAVFILLYMIILGQYNVLNILFVIYKTILICLVIKFFDISTNFNELNQSLYGLLHVFKKISVEKICYNISMSVYLIKYFIESKSFIKQRKRFNKKTSIGLRYNLYPKINYTVEKLYNLEFKFKANHCNFVIVESNFKSRLVMFTSVIFFIVCVFKEVIL